MTEAKRYHPLTMVLKLWKLVKVSFVIAMYLFVINFGSDSTFLKYGRITFFVWIGVSVLVILLKWLTHKYKLDDASFHLYEGVFTKSGRTIPFAKIQNVNRHTTLFHRLFNVTSIRFETGLTGEEAAVEFEVISLAEAGNMEKHVASPVPGEPATAHDGEAVAESYAEAVNPRRTVHFKPTKKDVMRASFTSLSFLVLIPLLASFYSKIDEIFHVKQEAKGLFSTLKESWWIAAILLVVLVVVSVAFGIVRTFVKYGKYEISSDSDRIYITKGLIDESVFSILKQRVQAVEITQSVLKRLLGLAEVKLISAGGLGDGEDKLEISTLYPFLPVQRAYEMISEILPAYEVTREMKRLPAKSLWLRMFRPSWLWILSTAALFYFKPRFLGFEQTWWVLSGALLMWIIVSRWLDYTNTRYVLKDNFIQFKTGSLTTALFVSKREKVIEVKVTRSVVQKWLGLASVGTINRAKPVRHAGIDDAPIELAESFVKWYMGRRKEIKVE
ncbi:PH domain-containing protein [Paenibacillus sp. MZ04-78.2]|uniref:PH domain-containing protein n=1 Tax=Paenibacillus sp. MZ04-78.2 TaxID=2962034 RepID=UPI0020B68C56|nr:PH domain-containing protein [Paenibacillus sp. MZ04-78.2]MCP3774368.1 PH domain-containing protein [Paenibacillus sp. MZ04-78.2]